MNDAQPLAGCRVLVTRPAHQARGLSERLRLLGGEALLCPTLAIEPLPAGDALAVQLPGLGAGDWVIFVSPNAVEHGMKLLERAGGLPAGVALAAVGEATAAGLRARSRRDVLVPEQGADSEALLAVPALQQVAGRRILIVRGVGGRELLGQTLRRRGASVAYAEVYRRVPAAAGAANLRRWLRAGAIDVVTVTSPAGLENLLQMTGVEERAALLGLPLVVVSARMLQLAATLGFQGPIQVAGGAGDEAVSDAVLALRRQRRGDER